MFNNNINKPAITVFLPLTSAKTSFCQWQKLAFAGKNYFCRDGFFRGKNRFLPVTGKNLPTLAWRLRGRRKSINRWNVLDKLLNIRTMTRSQCTASERASRRVKDGRDRGDDTVT